MAKLSEWQKDTMANINGTSLQAYITAGYEQLEELFGEPNEVDYMDGKVSTQWTFKLGSEVITLYDYKATDLYSSELPSVSEFRTWDKYEWHIGAKTKVAAEHFALWLELKLYGKANDL